MERDPDAAIQILEDAHEEDPTNVRLTGTLVAELIRLERYGEPTGLELSPELSALCRERSGRPTICGNAYRIPLPWWVFGLSALLALAIALLTVSYQSVRAAVSDPVDALKYE